MNILRYKYCNFTTPEYREKKEYAITINTYIKNNNNSIKTTQDVLGFSYTTSNPTERLK